MIVDFMLICLNLGYHAENWKARMESGVERGKTGCGWTAVGIVAVGNELGISSRPLVSGRMPLNSHSYLVGQGWQGTGKALREGAISRPVVIAQKKSLAGVGKDRDEAYPFWDQ